jgi:hypothetical protein
MVKAEDKKLARVQAMKAWVSGGIAPLIVNLAFDPCSALVEVNRHGPSSRLQPMIGYAAVKIGYHCNKKQIVN